jgi:hypothetical protein
LLDYRIYMYIHIYNIYYLFIKYWFVHFESNMFCSFSFGKNTLARWHTGILNRSIASKGLPKPPWSTLSLNIACCEGTWCKVKAMHRQETENHIRLCLLGVCACRIDFVASRVAKRHMRRSRERRVTTCYYHCMALIDLIVSHTTHMTSYDHQNVISRYRICASTTSMTMVQFRHFTCLFSDRVRRFGSSTKRRHWCRHGAITPLISRPTRRDRALLPS